MSKDQDSIAVILESLLFRMDEKTAMILKCLDMLTEDELWVRPNEASNSAGNLILHLCGNITQYAISALGRKEDIRERDLEFSTRGGYSKQQLTNKFSKVLKEAREVILSRTREEWLSEYKVQGFVLSGIGIAVHVVEHYAYHTGQLAFWTKQLKEVDLGFYSGTNLNTKNDE
ncbi:DinB family protein [Lentiprolixibacter aurantiacus]|uniref:DUF1572 family protein n=1 Tax=Lentiprolixibacter aurantiacus TaxID=2993939 RepID=A0AAE3MLC5_9FLAO|nr:DinB family protein [Lentiprolixibacter aurantiacus]MCX2719553.1 DUF1572 family protein [Lentiprolixibacter aurantiacus]